MKFHTPDGRMGKPDQLFFFQVTRVTDACGTRDISEILHTNRPDGQARPGFSSGYLKAVWPEFLGTFLRSGRPRGPGKAFKNVGG